MKVIKRVNEYVELYTSESETSDIYLNKEQLRALSDFLAYTKSFKYSNSIFMRLSTLNY